jgi:hypothetical protein
MADSPLIVQSRNTDFCIKEFEKFYDLLMSSAPKGYVPWLFPCNKMSKNPSSAAILKRDPNSQGSWLHKSARLDKEEAIQCIKEEWNIGLSARVEDPLIIIDIDKKEYLKQMPPNTLTTISRKREGAHCFGWDADGSAKINLPTKDGEIRSNNQYVLIPGSYVSIGEKDKTKLSPETLKDPLLGYYTVKDAKSPRKLTIKDVPQFFKDIKK